MERCREKEYDQASEQQKLLDEISRTELRADHLERSDLELEQDIASLEFAVKEQMAERKVIHEGNERTNVKLERLERGLKRLSQNLKHIGEPAEWLVEIDTGLREEADELTAKTEEETVELEEKMKECGLKLSSVQAEIEADKETQVARSAIYREQIAQEEKGLANANRDIEIVKKELAREETERDTLKSRRESLSTETQAKDLELSSRTNRVAILNTELTTLKAEMKEKDEESGRLEEESKVFDDERVEAVSDTQKMLEELAGGNAEIPQLEATLNSKSQLPDQIQAAEKDLSIVSRSIDEEQKILDGLKDAPVKKMIANELKDKLVYTSQAFQRRSADIDSRDELLRISEAEVAKLQSEIEANNDSNEALDAELDKLGRDREEAEATRKHKTETLADLKKVVADNEAVLKEQANSLDDSRIKLADLERMEKKKAELSSELEQLDARKVARRSGYESANQANQAKIKEGREGITRTKENIKALESELKPRDSKLQAVRRELAEISAVKSQIAEKVGEAVDAALKEFKEKAEAARNSIASEKAAKDKVAAEKAAKDRVAQEKATKEKIAAAEKAAKDKAAAEKAARDKVEAEKATAEKTAIEKSTASVDDAEPSGADRAAEEKIAAAIRASAAAAAAEKAAEDQEAASEKAKPASNSSVRQASTNRGARRVQKPNYQENSSTDSDEDGPAATLAMKRAASAARAGKKNRSVKENSSLMDVDVDQQGPESGGGGIRRDSIKRVTFAKSIVKSPCNAQSTDHTPEPAPKSTTGGMLVRQATPLQETSVNRRPSLTSTTPTPGRQLNTSNSTAGSSGAATSTGGRARRTLMGSGVGPVKKATPGIKRPTNPQPTSSKAAMNRSVSTGSVTGKPAPMGGTRVYDMFSTSEDEDNNTAFRSATSSARNITPIARRFSGKQYSKTPPSVSRGSSEQGASGGGKKSPYKFFGSKNTSATGTPASRQNSTTSFLRNGNDSDS